MTLLVIRLYHGGESLHSLAFMGSHILASCLRKRLPDSSHEPILRYTCTRLSVVFRISQHGQSLSLSVGLEPMALGLRVRRSHALLFDFIRFSFIVLIDMFRDN